MEGFEVFDELLELLASMIYLGHSGELTKISSFNKKYLPHLYNTLFTILNRHLIGKNSGIITATNLMAFFFQGVVENKHYDFVQLLFSDMVEMVTKTKNKKTMKYLPYVRLFSKVINSAMMRNPKIPRRMEHQVCDLCNMHLITLKNLSWRDL